MEIVNAVNVENRANNPVLSHLQNIHRRFSSVELPTPMTARAIRVRLRGAELVLPVEMTEQSPILLVNLDGLPLGFIIEIITMHEHSGVIVGRVLTVA